MNLYRFKMLDKLSTYIDLKFKMKIEKTAKIRVCFYLNV